MKLLKERCRECSICVMFFSSSLAVSINALFLSRILSAILIKEFLILFLTLVTSYMPVSYTHLLLWLSVTQPLSVLSFGIIIAVSYTHLTTILRYACFLLALTTVRWLLNQASGSFTHHLVG